LLSLLLALVFTAPLTRDMILFLIGLNYNARLNSLQVFITEFGNDENRIHYTTLASSIGATSFGIMPLLGGILLSTGRVSYTTLFIIGAVFSLAALFGFLFIVKHPGRTAALAQKQFQV
jgi:MFS family permease